MALPRSGEEGEESIRIEDEQLLGDGGNGDVGRSRASSGKKVSVSHLLSISAVICFVALISLSFTQSSSDETVCDAEIVQTVPLNTTGLGIGVNSTYTTFLWLIENAEKTIDLTAMYWTLDSPARNWNMSCPRHHACPDDANFTQAQLRAFGVDQGHAVFEALKAAARRGVSIRIVQSPGLGNSQIEPEALLAASDTVKVRTVDLKQWYNAGVLHAKIWVVDGRHGYVGSANMDWRSLTQTTETGVFLRECDPAVSDLSRIFNAFWEMGSLEPNDIWTRKVFDEELQMVRRVPCWSHLVDYGSRCSTPFNLPQGRHSRVKMNGSKEPSRVAFSLSPPELCGKGKIVDEDMLIDTVKAADTGGFVYISVMDFQPVTRFLCRPDAECPPYEQFYWPKLIDTMLKVATGKGVDVRLLVSHWAYDLGDAVKLLGQFQNYSEMVCPWRSTYGTARCQGSFEVREITIPGWNKVFGHKREYPGHSRVSHTKIIVSDKLANIGTSNMEWNYFHTTAGVSFNTDNPTFIYQLKKMFEQAWDHPEYTKPIVGERARVHNHHEHVHVKEAHGLGEEPYKRDL